jgi:hypothetical protein
MTDSKKPFEARGLTVDYRSLGTINLRELAHALIEDIHVLEDLYGVRYVKAARLRVFVTDEHGQEIKVWHPAGGTVRYLNTHHFRPACKDYEL